MALNLSRLKTPDVYIDEVSVFPPSVAEAESAIPAFIGYTQKDTRSAANDLHLRPVKVRSLKEYEALYGGPEVQSIEIHVGPDTKGELSVKAFAVSPANVPIAANTIEASPQARYLLYYAVKMFFDNGGGQCYIVSAGLYTADGAVAVGALNGNAGLLAGLAAIENEDEPTLIVIPELVRLNANEYADAVKAVLAQCARLQDRFGIFDLHGGGQSQDAAGLLANRAHFGTGDALKYGAAYYPFVLSSIPFPYEQTPSLSTDPETAVNVTITDAAGAPQGNSVPLASLKTTNTAQYNFVRGQLKERYVPVPPSGAVAGVYAWTDTNRGVWKAPANRSLADVVRPVIPLNNALQDELNVDATTGVSINALRAFAGKGTLVWGARTMAGNDNEWRYISVRRFFSVVEESVKKSTYWAVFEPNDAGTWVKVRGMIENYLVQKWREGALAGATPKEAFYVRCGLGVTMTAQDILEGRMIVEIGMAVVRPAEFIILRFMHKLQTS